MVISAKHNPRRVGRGDGANGSAADETAQPTDDGFLEALAEKREQSAKFTGTLEAVKGLTALKDSFAHPLYEAFHAYERRMRDYDHMTKPFRDYEAMMKPILGHGRELSAQVMAGKQMLLAMQNPMAHVGHLAEPFRAITDLTERMKPLLGRNDLFDAVQGVHQKFTSPMAEALASVRQTTDASFPHVEPPTVRPLVRRRAPKPPPPPEVLNLEVHTVCRRCGSHLAQDVLTEPKRSWTDTIGVEVRAEVCEECIRRSGGDPDSLPPVPPKRPTD